MTEDDQLFTLDVVIDAPIGRVWHALRDREELMRWHGWDFDGLAAEVDEIYLDHVVALDESYTLTVDGGDRFELSDVDGRTRLRMTRAPRGTDPRWDEYYEDINEGWTMFVQQLRFAVERHPGAPRRTVHLSEEGEPIRTRLLSTVLSGQPGEKYEATAPAGDRLTGEVWFRSTNQVGCTVDGWGDGLLIAAEHVPSPPHPHGGGMLTLTTYGLDDEAFRRVEGEWTRCWSGG